MRVRVRGLVVAVLAAGGLLAGCAPAPTGTDGDLLNQWTSLPEPEPFVPAPSVCHTSYRPTGSLTSYQPVDCDDAGIIHKAETVYIGVFVGEAAERESPPNEGTEIWRSAYQECDEAAADYLGADFRYGPLWLGVTVPSAAGWDGGARWFRCEITPALNATEHAQLGQSSLAGALADDSDLRLGCSQTDETFADIPLAADISGRVVDCAEVHDREFVGLWEAPDRLTYPEWGDNRVLRGCVEVALEYMGVTEAQVPSGRIYVGASRLSRQDWDNGDRTYQCYMRLWDAEVTGSLEGVGAAGLREALR